MQAKILPMFECGRVEDEEEKYDVLHSIGDIARILGLSTNTIRMYEREGLLIPLRTSTNQRVYTERDLDFLKTIRELMTNDGISIAGIRYLLALLPCWSIAHCPKREQCAAHVEVAYPCWVLRAQAGKDTKVCRSCQVYHRAYLVKNLKSVLRVFPV
jgi:MerR family transcriptional regulator/heat shock protein HspR